MDAILKVNNFVSKGSVLLDHLLIENGNVSRGFRLKLTFKTWFMKYADTSLLFHLWFPMSYRRLIIWNTEFCKFYNLVLTIYHLRQASLFCWLSYEIFHWCVELCNPCIFVPRSSLLLTALLHNQMVDQEYLSRKRDHQETFPYFLQPHMYLKERLQFRRLPMLFVVRPDWCTCALEKHQSINQTTEGPCQWGG